MTMTRKIFLLVGLLSAAGLFVGCPASQGSQVRPGPGPQPDPGPPPTPAVSRLSLRGYLAYRSGVPGKRFYWSLRFYENSGLVIGNGRDRDGYAEFFGTYNRRSKRFWMVKYFKYRRSGRKRYYYRGYIRNGRLLGTAHMGGFWGRKYAGWAGSVRFQRMAFTQGQPRRFVLRGRLQYHTGNAKSFVWQLNYFRSSGTCYGSVKDRDGVARFYGVYDKPTKRFFLRKRFRDGRVFYYTGYMTPRGAFGTARRRSFTYRRTYARWRAVMVWRR